MSAVTSYEGQRRRIRLMESLEAILGDLSVSAARRNVSRATGLTPDQLVNIRKGKLKGLWGERKAKIDEVFVRITRRQIKDLQDELESAQARDRRLDPGLVAQAQASFDELKSLIAEAEQVTAANRPGEAQSC